MTNVADTVWQPRGDLEGEYSNVAVVNIIDPSDSTIELVDPSSNPIVDTGVAYTEVSATVWSASDGS